MAAQGCRFPFVLACIFVSISINIDLLGVSRKEKEINAETNKRARAAAAGCQSCSRRDVRTPGDHLAAGKLSSIFLQGRGCLHLGYGWKQISGPDVCLWPKHPGLQRRGGRASRSRATGAW